MVTPTASGFSFVPATQSVVGLGGFEVVWADFRTSFTISGAVSKAGVAVAGTLVTCGSQGGLRQTTSDGSGSYSFSVFTNEGVWTISAGGKSLTIALSVQAISGLPSQTYSNANILS